MITVEGTGRELVLEGELPSGSVAYIDADWISGGGSQSIPTLLAESVSDAAVAGALHAVAAEAAALAANAPVEAVEVIGRGFVARAVRRLLSIDGRGVHQGAHEVIVDAVCTAETLAGATRRLSDLGLLVLAGETSGQIALDLYPDVHVRGLRFVGVRPAVARVQDARLAPSDGWDLPVSVNLGEPLDPAAAWYRIDRV